ncbi:MAG: M23 family metallopeptidase, partial [Cyanobacteria bacterium J06648_11]
SGATIAPNPAKLGDTLSVRVKVAPNSSQPTVRLGTETFAMFPLKADPASGQTIYRALVPTSPLSQAGAQTLTIQAGGQSQQISVPLGSRQFPHQSIRFSGSGGLEATDKELDAVAAFKASRSPQKLWNGAFLRPTGGYVSAVYGVRRSYNGEFAQDYYHRGVDYAIDSGTPVVAPAGGKVVLIGRHNDGFVVHGNTVGLDHGQGVTSIFIHLSSIDVAEGQTVAAGTRIGRVGTTGASTGPHLHWGLFVHGVAVDPVPWRYGGIE